MKPVFLIAMAPLALSACNFGQPVGNVSTANGAAPAVVPDSVTVNGVTYVRAGLDKITPTDSATTAPVPAPLATSASAVSDTGASVPTNTDTAGASGDHGN